MCVCVCVCVCACARCELIRISGMHSRLKMQVFRWYCMQEVHATPNYLNSSKATFYYEYHYNLQDGRSLVAL